MSENCDAIKNSIDAGENMEPEKPATFANILRAAARPKVLIKPKNDSQDATATSKEIKEKIDHRDINACGMRKIRGGVVIVDCATNTSSLKMKLLIEEKFGAVAENVEA